MAGTFSFLWRSFLLVSFPLVANSKVQLKILTEETWQEMLVGEWMIEFFAPWCPACRQLEPVWEEFAGWSEDLGIQVGSVDVTTNPGLSGRFAITALPTIFHVKDGVFRQYRGSKRKDELISFIEDVKWKEIEPIPSWKSPQSIQMSSLAYFFKFSMFLRNVHNELVELGIPYWGSYIIFGLATIFLGAILGLLIVYIIDHLCPAKKPYESDTHRASQYESKADKKGVNKSDKMSSKPEGESNEEQVEVSPKATGLNLVEGEAEDEKLSNISEDEEKEAFSVSEEEEEEDKEEKNSHDSEGGENYDESEERDVLVKEASDASKTCVGDKEKDNADQLTVRKRTKCLEEKEE